MQPGRWKANLFRVDADHPGSTDPAQTVEATADHLAKVMAGAEHWTIRGQDHHPRRDV